MAKMSRTSRLLSTVVKDALAAAACGGPRVIALLRENERVREVEQSRKSEDMVYNVQSV